MIIFSSLYSFFRLDSSEPPTQPSNRLDNLIHSHSVDRYRPRLASTALEFRGPYHRPISLKFCSRLPCHFNFLNSHSEKMGATRPYCPSVTAAPIITNGRSIYRVGIQPVIRTYHQSRVRWKNHQCDRFRLMPSSDPFSVSCCRHHSPSSRPRVAINESPICPIQPQLRR